MHLYPTVHFKCVYNIYFLSQNWKRTTKKKPNLLLLSCHIGQFDYQNALLFFQVLVNMNESISFPLEFVLHRNYTVD